MRNRILVLGHTGFLGSALCKRLELHGIEFKGISRSNGYDLRNSNTIQELVRLSDFDTIINCAAHVGGIQYGIEFQRQILIDNTLLNLNIFELARLSQAKLINPISNCAYPGTLNKYDVSEFWNGDVHDSVYAYAHTRRQLVSATNVYNRDNSLEIANVVFPNIFGPGEHLDPKKAHALGGITYRLIESRNQKLNEFMIWGSGKPVREWLYIDDAITALVNSIDTSFGKLPVNVGQGLGISIMDLVSQINSYVGFTGDVQCDLSFPDGATEKLMVPSQEYNLVLNFMPFSKGIEATVEYYEKAMSKL